jgi:hypothetical protein
MARYAPLLRAIALLYFLIFTNPVP